MYEGKSSLTRLALKTILDKLGIENDIDVGDVEELRKRKACFVTLHMNSGELRGCIGTMKPYRLSLYDEIVENAKSAAFKDPRFNSLSIDEVEDINVSVDVLEIPERIDSIQELNPKLYGVIVEKGKRRGVLLPDLEGVEDVEHQLSIAMRKAGIAGGEKVIVYRFRVERYY